MKSTTRIALVFFLVTLATMVVLSAAVYYFVTEYTYTDFYKRLQTRAVLTARIAFDSDSSSVAYQQMREQILEKLPQEEDYIYEITPGKTFQAESEKLNLPVSFFNSLMKGQASEYQKKNIFYYGIPYQIRGKSYIVIVSAENYYYTNHITNLKRSLTGVVIFISLLVLIVSIFFSRYVFNPVRQITKQVKNIGSENLHLRLQASIKNDDINELKNTFNTMLDRLETSFATQNNFISNASHELRTPLTAIVGEADLALAKERSPAEYKQSLSLINTQAEKLQNLTAGLLSLAHTGFDGRKQHWERIRIDELLFDVKSAIDSILPQNHIKIIVRRLPQDEEAMYVLGNRQLLRTAISNVIMNGCKYSGNQPVTVHLDVDHESAIIEVIDKGIGIPQEELKYIYDPFFRASNTAGFEGYGIGMPLSNNIIRIHSGRIEVESIVNQGTTVRLVLPIATTL